jgi:transcriptional regulator with XRE-family HTH domain
MATPKKKPATRNPKVASQWVGLNVRKLRESRDPKMNQSELGDAMTALGFPMDKTKVSKLENGRETRVDVDKLIALATVLDVIPDRLLRDPDELDSAIFDRLVRRWGDLVIDAVAAETRSEVLWAEIQAIVERMPALQENLNGSIAMLARMGFRARSSDVDFGSPNYDAWLDELLSGPALEHFLLDELEVVEARVPYTMKKGGK